MQKEVRLDVNKQMLHAQFSSDSTIEDWKSALIQVVRLTEETGICRVLVDVRKQTRMASTFELFNFGSQLPRSIAFAVLFDIHFEDHHFIESVAKNRGMIVKMFDSEQDAIEWLMNWPNKSIDSDKK